MRWLTALLLLAPQEVRLQPRVAVGDKAAVTVDSALDLEITVKDGEGESNRFLSVTRREKFSQEVTRVADGRPVALAIQCLSSTLQKSGTNVALSVVVTPLSGRAFVGTRSAQGWVVKDQEGKAPPAEGAALGAWNDYERLLPKGAVKVNDKWKVDGGGLADLFFEPGASNVQGSLECTLESFSGGRATILVNGSLEGHSKDGSSVTLTLTGSRLVFDASGGKPMSLTVNGELRTRRDVVDAFIKAGGAEEEKRKVGEIHARSSKLEVSFVFD